MTVYDKINKALQQHENHKYAERSLESIAGYLDWAWKWRKITPEQKDELVDRWLILNNTIWNKEHGNYD